MGLSVFSVASSSNSGEADREIANLARLDAFVRTKITCPLGNIPRGDEGHRQKMDCEGFMAFVVIAFAKLFQQIGANVDE